MACWTPQYLGVILLIMKNQHPDERSIAEPVTSSFETTVAKAAVVAEAAHSKSLDLPPHIVRRAVRRIRFVAALSIFIQVVFWAFLNLLEGDLPGDLRQPLQWIPNVAIIVSSLAILLLSHRERLAPKRVITLGLGYLVIVSYAIALSQYWDAFSGIPATMIDADLIGLSHVAVWMLFYTVLVPTRPSRVLIALLVSATAVPVTYVLMVQHNDAPSLGLQAFVSVLVAPYVVVAFIAYITARIVYRLGQDVRRAQELGSYRLTERLGSGGMGEVWRATHRMLARPAAVKLIRAEALCADPAARAVAQARFEREAQVTASLQSPHTIELYDFGVTETGTFYYVMELLHGRDLDALVRRFGPLPAERVVHILRQACASLAEAHAHGLVHRDIKPANLYLCRRAFEYDFVKVLDFGLVKHRADAGGQRVDLSQTGIVPGTPSFMAPEMILGEDGVDGRADLYALGLTLYEMAAGTYPFEAPDLQQMVRRQLQEAAPPVRSARPGLSRFFAAVVDRLLEKDLAARFPDAARLFKLLEDGEDSPCWNGRDLDLDETMVSEEIPALVPEPPPPGAASAPSGRVWLVPLLVGACLALFAVVLVLLLR